MTASEQYTDQEVISRILDGATALFEILIRRNNPFLYKTGRAYHYSHEDTQDLMQDTLVDAYLHLDQFDHRSSFKTWLLRIMLNNCYRKRQKMSFKKEVVHEWNDQAVPLFAVTPQNDTNKMFINKELRSVIEQALEQVPLDYRLVFSLREMTGLNVSETAEVLNISESNVKVRLNRAKSMLRKEVEKVYTADDLFEFNLVYCDAIVEKVMRRIGEQNKAEA